MLYVNEINSNIKISGQMPPPGSWRKGESQQLHRNGYIGGDCQLLQVDLFPTLKHIWYVMLYLQAVLATHGIAMVRKKHKMQDFDLQSYLICFCSKAVVKSYRVKKSSEEM